MACYKTEIELRQRLDICLAVLKQYSWLLDSYILDFFVEHHFENLPNSWLLHFNEMSMRDLAVFMDFQNSKYNGVWPLSLTTLHFLLKHLSLPRDPNHDISDVFQKIKTKKIFEPDSVNTISTVEKSLHLESNKNKTYGHVILNNPKLKTSFTKGVKPKKRYEILKMAEITAATAERSNIDHLVDVGSGLGHLSRICGYGYGFNVLSIESQLNLSKEAQKLDQQFEVIVKKYLTQGEIEVVLDKSPTHIQQTITYDMSSDGFMQLIKESCIEGEQNFTFGIVGLHPCGNLALKLLKLFIVCEEARFINIVGCCYHKLTTSGDYALENNFPTSNYLREKNVSLSYEAKALACHALEAYCKRLLMNDYHHLKIHCYRATLEHVINKNWPNLRKSPLNNVKHGPGLTFESYCVNALKKLHVTIPKEDLKSKETLKHLSEWKNVVLYYSLRLMMAPLIETTILMDRMLFLMENGTSSFLNS